MPVLESDSVMYLMYLIPLIHFKENQVLSQFHLKFNLELIKGKLG